MVAAVVHGVGAIAYGAKPIPAEKKDGDKVMPIDFERGRDAAVTWFTQVFDQFGTDAFKDKNQVLRSVPVLGSIGALGQGYFSGARY